MARIVLTDALIRAKRPPAAGKLEIADMRCVGLSIRITANGIRSWCFRFRDKSAAGANGTFQRATLGRYPDLPLSKARERADELRKEVAAGINPVARDRQQRAEGRTNTFKALAERFMVEHSRRKKRSHGVDDRNLRLHVLPALGAKPYAKITRSDVIELLERLVSQGKPILANRVQALISTIFSFAVDAGRLTANPCARLKRRGQERRRSRVLSDDELRVFWPGIVTSPVSRPVGLALRLALLTGCRVGEVAGISRNELHDLQDENRATWLIPVERSKNKRAHLVPLSPLAREIVLELVAGIDAAERHLLPTRARRPGKAMGKSASVTGHALTNGFDRFGNKLEGEAAGVASWKAADITAHDLRRTVETRLSSLGVPKEDRDAVLNHVAHDVGSRHYDQYDRLAEKRRALNLWAAALDNIINNRVAVVLPMVRAHAG